MRVAVLNALLGVCLLVRAGSAGQHTTGSAVYQRVICVVPIVGKGTLDDPKRPLFSPVAGSGATGSKLSKGFADAASIVAFHSVLSDDGSEAIVEFVARDRAAFAPLLEAKRLSRVRLFDVQHDKHDEVLTELRKVKKSFDFSMLEAGTL